MGVGGREVEKTVVTNQREFSYAPSPALGDLLPRESLPCVGERVT